MITWATIVWALLGFSAMVALQVFVWRVQQAVTGKVSKQIFWIILLHFVLPLLLFIGYRDIAVLVLWQAVALGYIFAFPAVSAKSPTVEMLMLIRDRGASGGISKQELVSSLATDNLIGDRLLDLADDGLIKVRASGTEELSLSSFGKLVAVCFYYYRRALKLPLGTG